MIFLNTMWRTTAVRVALIGLLACSLAACGKARFSYDDPDILVKMTSGMTKGEAQAFASDLDLLVIVWKNERRLEGYTVDQVKAEALRVRQSIARHSAQFLAEYIQELEQQGRSSGMLHIDPVGGLSKPVVGYRAREYSLEQLKDRYAKLIQEIEGPKEMAFNSPAVLKNPSEDKRLQELVQAGNAENSSAASIASRKFEEGWRRDKDAPQHFINECVDDNSEKAKRLGGVVVTQSDLDNWRTHCQSKYAKLRACMNRKNSSAGVCYEEIKGEGD